ncbi:MAG TPA: DUF2318 domain-containing protein [Methanocella sp.]|jgi:uncharacterized membrane protein
MASNNGKKPEAKKAQERLDEKKKKQKKTVYMGVAVVLALVVLAVGYILLNGGQSDANDPALYNQSGTDTGGQNVVIPLSDIADTSFHFYSYDSGGVGIKYFIVKDSSGNLHTAFDACDVCYAAKKGYRQVGDVAKCNNCGKTFAVAKIGTENTAGGCWPGYLPNTIEGNNIMIKSTDLESGKYRFE